jgi:hypothetical protein
VATAAAVTVRAACDGTVARPGYGKNSKEGWARVMLRRLVSLLGRCEHCRHGQRGRGGGGERRCAVTR